MAMGKAKGKKRGVEENGRGSRKGGKGEGKAKEEKGEGEWEGKKKRGKGQKETWEIKKTGLKFSDVNLAYIRHLFSIKRHSLYKTCMALYV